MWHYFTDPVLKAPTLGCTLMCLASSLIGVLAFLQKRSLVGEALSHSTYPGVVMGAFIFSLLFPEQDMWTFIGILCGALIAGLLSLSMMQFLQKKAKVSSDASLCFVLSVFFGCGIVFASLLQSVRPLLYKQAQLYLFGQAATMVDMHIYIYLTLSIIIIGFLAYSYRFLQLMLFDHEYAKSIGKYLPFLQKLIFFLFVLSIIIGIRSVGIVLMSAMLIAPAVAARAFTHRLHIMFVLAGIFGALSGLLGNILSVELSHSLSSLSLQRNYTLPTGPIIAIIGSSFALFGLLFSPKRGIVFRMLRMLKFQLKCVKENILKDICKNECMLIKELKKNHHLPLLVLYFLVFKMCCQGWIIRKKNQYYLTKDGKKRALHIIRLHRLWEVYLTECMGFQIDRVHRNAEEMEHIITPDLEKKLSLLLSNPKKDPHQKPIPEGSIL